mmetsp:Transcript_79006/g.229451  ORF Transcript_79006/g.229451 Transcript_79006/m.229451 type:complete len:226 (+) Transcript_79006:404-1081(+)
MHANFVLQRAIEVTPQDGLDFIVDEIQKHAVYVCLHRYASRSVQRLLERCVASQLEVLVGHIVRNIDRLASHPFGSNVLRHLLRHGGAWELRNILVSMTDNVAELALDRCGSLVLEKCVQVATTGPYAQAVGQERDGLMRALLREGGCGSGGSMLQRIALDRYGNYVAQRVVECSRGGEVALVEKQLGHLEADLRKSATGRHILSCMRRHLGVRRGRSFQAVGGA